MTDNQPKNSIFSNNNSFSSRLNPLKIIGGTITKISLAVVFLAASLSVQAATVGGNITSSLGGSVELSLNGEKQSFSTSGAFSFTTALASGTSYRIEVTDQPVNQVCQVTSGGVGEATPSNITNVAVSCNARVVNITSIMKDGKQVDNYNPKPIVYSIVEITERSTGKPVTGLLVTNDADNDFIGAEGVKPISSSEGYLNTEPLDLIESKFETVLLLDNSQSINFTQLTELKEAAKLLVQDENGKSKISDGNTVSVYTFDGTKSTVIENSNDAAAIVSAIDTINRGNSSTNLYGAIFDSFDEWVDDFDLDLVTKGALFVLTDGEDTSGIKTAAQAAAARNNKDIYVFTINGVPTATLNDLTMITGNSDHVVTNLSFDKDIIANAFNEAQEAAYRYHLGKYFVRYLSPTRSGSHTFSLSLNNNPVCGGQPNCQDTVSGDFNASLFSDVGAGIVLPEIVVYGDPVIPVGITRIFPFSTRWSNDSPNYEWVTTDANNVFTINIDAGQKEATITANKAGVASSVIFDCNFRTNSDCINSTTVNTPLNLSTPPGISADGLSGDTLNMIGDDFYHSFPLQTFTGSNFVSGTYTSVSSNGDVLTSISGSNLIIQGYNNGAAVVTVTDTTNNLTFIINVTVNLTDTDFDGTQDVYDYDDDNDGVLDVDDAFPLDNTEYIDTDGDEIGNNTDTDDDGDGVLDIFDRFPLDGAEWIDTDNDGTGNNADTDDDGDGNDEIYQSSLDMSFGEGDGTISLTSNMFFSQQVENNTFRSFGWLPPGQTCVGDSCYTGTDRRIQEIIISQGGVINSSSSYKQGLSGEFYLRYLSGYNYDSLGNYILGSRTENGLKYAVAWVPKNGSFGTKIFGLGELIYSSGTSVIGIANINDAGNSYIRTVNMRTANSSIKSFGNNLYASSALTLNDGTIIAVGTNKLNESSYSTILVKFLVSGAGDNDFGTDGLTSIDIGNISQSEPKAIEMPNGKILISDTNSNGQLVLVQYNSNGALDTSFENNGTVIRNIGAHKLVSIGDIKQQTDGKLLITATTHSGTRVLIRTSSNGSLDGSFDGDGILISPYAEKIMIQANGKIVLESEGSLARYLGTSVTPTAGDSDDDGLPDSYENANGLNPVSNVDALQDNDNDGYTNLDEYLAGTNPNNPSSKPAALTPATFGFESGSTLMGWDFSADSPWTTSSSVSYDGTQSLASATIDHYGRSEVSYFGKFHAGTVKFRYKTSSEAGFDELKFYIDGVEQDDWSGNDGWQLANYPITSGFHTLTWKYIKDVNGSDFDDKVWIDNVQLPLADDADGDGLSDVNEMNSGTDINNPDSDGDGLTDGWEYSYFAHFSANSGDDDDNDGLSNLQEFYLGTDPTNNDTDGDGILDSQDDDPLVAVKSLYVDINKNEVVDLPLLGSLSNGKKAVMFYDSLTGAQTGVVYIPSWFNALQVEVLSDINGNGFNDVAVLGTTSDGKKAWLTFDTKTGKLLTAVVFPAWFQPRQLAVVPDYNGNNKDEILVLGETSDGKKVWMLHDSGLKVEIGRYIYPSWYSPTSISIVKDTDGNNIPEVVSSGTSSDGRSTWMLHDLDSKSQLRAVKQAPWFILNNLQQLDDVSGNTLDDVVWLGNTTDGKNFFKIEDANTGTLDSIYIYPTWYTPSMITSQQDTSGNGYAEIVSLGITSDGKKAWLAHDAYNHTVSAAKVFPAWYQPQTLKVLPDVNGDGVEDILVRGSTTDGKSVIMVQNGATGADIKVLILPSWFVPAQ